MSVIASLIKSMWDIWILRTYFLLTNLNYLRKYVNKGDFRGWD